LFRTIHEEVKFIIFLEIEIYLKFLLEFLSYNNLIMFSIMNTIMKLMNFY
jgi:hypothetical protein